VKHRQLLFRTIFSFLFVLLFFRPAFGAAIRTLDEGSSGSFCKQYDFVGATIAKTNTGLNCTITSTATAGAPDDATYITQTSDGDLSAEQALDALATGILRVDTADGVITSLTDSAGIADNISDETGTGVMCFATAPTFTTSIIVTSGATIDADGVDVVTGNDYEVNGTSVLTNDTLGSGVVNSSLDSVDALNSGSITTGFGNIDVGASSLAGGSLDLSEGNITNGGIASFDSLIGEDNVLAIGDNSETIEVNSSDWDISTTGVQTGMGDITSNGKLTVSDITLSPTAGILEIGTGILDIQANAVKIMELDDTQITVINTKFVVSGGDSSVEFDDATNSDPCGTGTGVLDTGALFFSSAGFFCYCDETGTSVDLKVIDDAACSY